MESALSRRGGSGWEESLVVKRHGFSYFPILVFNLTSSTGLIPCRASDSDYSTAFAMIRPQNFGYGFLIIHG